MKWDYGFVERGLSFEYTNLWDALRRMDNVEATFLDFMIAYKAGGHDQVRKELRESIAAIDPKLVFFLLFTDEIPQDTLADLRDDPKLLTFNWFADDHWRFDDFTRHWAPLFNACSTTARSALPKYAAMGYGSVIKTQWACNHHLYQPGDGRMKYGVTFVGQPHGDRVKVIKRLRRSGIDVETWGTGWPRGRLSQAEMIGVFGSSRVNLNLSNASVRASGLKRMTARRRYGDQIKGRNFEIPGCAGFQISGRSEDIENYYEPDREIVLYGSPGELVEKTRRYLADESAREAIAEAGYRRTLAQHTYAHRFRAIFTELGLLT
jgi:spore maturation protein CgeB